MKKSLQDKIEEMAKKEVKEEEGGIEEELEVDEFHQVRLLKNDQSFFYLKIIL
jgi:hypothetical protein